jgi:phospholipid transport system substrate-binding protein
MYDLPRARSRLALVLLAALVAQSASGEPASASGEPAAQTMEPAPATAATPTQVIDALHASLLDVMKNAVALGYPGREQKLRSVVPQHFDVKEMARKSLGEAQWKLASEEAKRRYLETFERFMVANYAGRFDGFSGQSFQTLGEVPDPRPGAVIVKTRLIDPTDKNIDLNYRMRQVGGTWKVIDVYLDGTVSELAVRRSEFVSIVKRENLDALIVALDAKIAKLAAGGES